MNLPKKVLKDSNTTPPKNRESHLMIKRMKRPSCFPKDHLFVVLKPPFKSKMGGESIHTTSRPMGLRALWPRREDLADEATEVTKNGKSKHKGRKSKHAGDTSSTSDEDTSGEISDFVLECDGGKSMVYVTHGQAKQIVAHSDYFRVLFRMEEDRVVRKPEWSLANTRRIIELLSNGSVFIENNKRVYADLVLVAKEVAVEVRLASLINFHDTLSREDTKRFFDLMDHQKYQFRIQAAVTAKQWLHLMRQGILLLSNTKILMLKLAGRSVPKQPCNDERYKNCDAIRLEFCVYAEGSMNVLYRLLDVLSPPTSAETKATHAEEFRLVFQASQDVLDKEDLGSIARITSSTLSPAEDRDTKYLKSSDNGTDTSKKKSTYTLTSASILVLQSAFACLLGETEDVEVALLVQSPTPDTLGRFIHAAQQASKQDKKTGYPVVDMNLQEQTFALRASCMPTLLSILSDYSTSAIVMGDFLLHHI